jgi:cytochrome P450
MQSAVIREGLRLSYGLTTRLPRIAHEDIKYKEWVIPAGVRIITLPFSSQVVFSFGLVVLFGQRYMVANEPNKNIFLLQTPVSETAYFVLTDPSIFPNPTLFRPERWLEPENDGKRLDKYLVSFGKGSRQCLGMKY